MSDLLAPHRPVRETGCPNFGGRRIPEDVKLNIPNWRFYLADLGDKQLLNLLEFAFH